MIELLPLEVLAQRMIHFEGSYTETVRDALNYGLAHYYPDAYNSDGFYDRGDYNNFVDNLIYDYIAQQRKAHGVDAEITYEDVQLVRTTLKMAQPNQ